MELLDLPVETIIVDPDIQPRERLSDSAIMEYGDAMLAGDKFPPLVVLYQERDRWWLASGFLRLAAAKAIGRETIRVEADVGDKRTALMFSCTTNARHGLRRTNRDKRRAVLKLLGDKTWAEWSDREIARICRVSPGLVCAVRAELGIGSNEQIETAEEIGRRKRRFMRGGQEHEMRMPQKKDRSRHAPERWALVQIYESIDALNDNVVDAGIEPDAVLEYLTPERETRLHVRLFECLKWLGALDDLLGNRALEVANDQ